MATLNSGTTTITLTAVIPATLLADLGIPAGSNTVGTVLTLPYRDALALVQGGYASFGSTVKDAGDFDEEGGHVDYILPAAGGPIAANATVNGDGVDARGAAKARLLAGADVAITVAIEQSLDGNVWLRPVAGTAVAAGGSTLLEQPVGGRYVRGVILNGAAAAVLARARLSLGN